LETPHALLRSRLAQHLERGSVTAGCLDELLEIASDAADDSAPSESSFADRVEAKLTELTSEFHTRYGATLGEATWRRFLADNS
ncbi:MAG: hypothetical protein ACR2HI_11485, partial [Gaiella sp.]